MRSWITLLVLFSFVSSTYTSPRYNKPLSKYIVDSWDHADGLPGPVITSLIQTRDGYLWIGTANGLVRFDGIRFVTLNRKSHPTLASNRIRTLFEDRRGTLWIGTEGGGVSQITKGLMTTKTSQDGIPSDYVRAVSEDTAGNIWIGTDGEGVCVLMPDTMLTFGRENSIIDERITSLLSGRDGAMWVGTYGGLFKYSDGTWSKFTRREGLSSDTIACMMYLGDELWVGTMGSGLTIMKDGHFSLPAGDVALPQTIVTGIAGNEHEGVFVSTFRRGVCKIRDGVLSSRTVAGHDRGEFISAILLDREGNVWAGLQTGALVRLKDAAFEWFPSTFEARPDGVRSLFEDSDTTMWAGTASALRRLTGDQFIPAFSSRGRPINILSVGQDDNGTMWVGTLGNGLQRVSRQGFVRVNAGRTPAVWALFTDKRGTLWAGTNGGLVRLRDGNPVLYTHDNNHLSHDDVRAICQRADGSLWVGTSYGLNTLVGDSFVSYTKSNSALSNDVIISLNADTSGDIWVGTQAGLNRLRDTSFVSFTSADGLPDDAVGLILEDDDGFFWIAGDNGLYRIGKESLNRYAAGIDTALHYIAFGASDGVLDPGIAGSIQPAGWKSRDGRLWFATNSGIAVADPRYLRLNPEPPVPVIEQIAVDQRTIRLDSITSFSHDINQIEIDYTSPTFVNPGKVRFRYRLKGLTNHWIDAGTRRTAYFTNIPPGEYTFEVMATNETGVWGAQAGILPLTILPPFWQTWWFRWIIILLFLSVGPAIYFRRVAQLQRRHAQQREFSTRLIASQEAERKRIASGLHDSLGQNIIIIKNRALMGKQAGDDRNSVTEQLDEISRTASATLDEMRKIAYNLRPLNLERFGLTETIVQVAKDVGTAAGIPLVASVDNVDKLFTQEVEMHIFRIIQEALNNIVKHSSATAGTVSIEVSDAAVRMVVSDNGHGFDATDKSHASGFGLYDIRERVNLIGGKLALDSSAGKGTILTITLPLPENRS